jgi:hypothetical protein
LMSRQILCPIRLKILVTSIPFPSQQHWRGKLTGITGVCAILIWLYTILRSIKTLSTTHIQNVSLQNVSLQNVSLQNVSSTKRLLTKRLLYKTSP